MGFRKFLLGDISYSYPCSSLLAFESGCCMLGVLQTPNLSIRAPMWRMELFGGRLGVWENVSTFYQRVEAAIKFCANCNKYHALNYIPGLGCGS